MVAREIRNDFHKLLQFYPQDNSVIVCATGMGVKKYESNGNSQHSQKNKLRLFKQASLSYLLLDKQVFLVIMAQNPLCSHSAVEKLIFTRRGRGSLPVCNTAEQSSSL